MEEYLPLSPENKNAEEYNKNLPGMGGIYNSRNLQTYHYAGNNPLKYVDPTGESVLEKFKSSIARVIVRIGVNSFGGPLTKAMYNAALDGKFTSNMLIDNDVDRDLGLGLKNALSNQNTSLNQHIVNEIKNHSTGSSGLPRWSNWGDSDLSNTLGTVDYSYSVSEPDENGLRTVTVTVKDKWDFDPKAKGKRGKMAELLTRLANAANIIDNDNPPNIEITYEFQVDEHGNVVTPEE
jgi:hypothetical protein